MAELVALIAEWITQFLLGVGMLGIFLALAVESACIPITSEVFLLFGGFLVARGEFSLLETSLAGTAGFTVGSLLPYYVGRRHGKAILGRGGRFFLASEGELDKVEAWFERHGYRAVLLGRFVPLVRDFISLPAGHARMPLGRFLLYTALGAFPWILGVTYLGNVLESRWETALDFLNQVNQAVLALLLVAFVALAVRSWRRRTGRPVD